MPEALLKSTVTLPESRNGNGCPSEDPSEVNGESNGHSNGELAPGSRPRTRRTRTRLAASASERRKGRKLTIRDSVFARLELQAIRKGSTVSAIVDEMLDRELPRLKITQEDP
jgi:hypothetical protein